jgi:hypothetical protein
MEKAARPLVDHALIPLEHESESTAEHAGRFLVMNLRVWISLAGHGCVSFF